MDENPPFPPETPETRKVWGPGEYAPDPPSESKRAPIPDEQRCTAHASDGSGRRCKKSRMRGQSTCLAHGGGQGAAKRNARERLLAAVDPAISVLVKALRKAEKENNYDASSIRAALGILDRTGHGTSSDLNISGSINANIAPALNLDALTMTDKVELIRLLTLAGAMPEDNSVNMQSYDVQSSHALLVNKPDTHNRAHDSNPTSKPELDGQSFDDWSSRQLIGTGPEPIEAGDGDYAVI
jgi:hypothetical protein